MSLYIWDTDHFSLYQRSHPKITARLRQHSPGDVVVTVVTVEELLRGRLAGINSSKNEDERLDRLRWFRETLDMLKSFPIRDYSVLAKSNFDNLRRQKLRVGSQDLRIAAVTISLGGILVTRNTVDFGKIAGLTIQDWTV